MSSRVLVTGGSNGIGKAVCKKFIEEDYKVLVFDIEEPDYDVDYFEVDVRSEEQVNQAIGQLEELDVLINNAGVYRKTSVDNFKQEDFYDIFEVNVKGYRIMYTSCLKLLSNSRDGNVVNISSGLSKSPEPYSDMYSASKAAINSLTISWANNYDETKVRSNAVLPNPVKTKMLEENFSEKELEEYKKLQPMRRFSKPEEIAKSVYFLAKNDSFNGSKLEVGGEANANQYTT